MARQRFFPRNRDAQPEWLRRYAGNLADLAPLLGLPPSEVADSIADARYLEYGLGSYLTSARAFSPAATAAVRRLARGEGTEPVPMPEFHPPPLPAGVVPVPPGALPRIMKFIQIIKARPAYTDAIGRQLGIIGAGEAAAKPAPTFTLEIENGATGQRVRVRFKKYGHKGVAIYSRRAGGDWEMLGVDLTSPFVDKRALLVAGQPETREYRLRFFDRDASTGEYTPVATIVVGA